MDERTFDELLKDIEEKKGPYSQDHLTHAENVIEHASECAKEIRKRLQQLVKELADFYGFENEAIIRLKKLLGAPS
jgi:hypothetical protein